MVEPTELKNMLIKLDHFPTFPDEHLKTYEVSVSPPNPPTAHPHLWILQTKAAEHPSQRCSRWHAKPQGVDDDLQEVLVNVKKSYDLLRGINQNNTSPENHETQRIINII